MELQFNQSEIRTLTHGADEVRNAELTQEMKLPEGMPDIGRVLTSWGQIVIRSKEWNRDEVVVTGGLMVWVLYLPEDGTEVRSVENWIPLHLKWDVDPAAREGAIRASPVLRFVDSRGTASRKILSRAGISMLGQAFSPVNVAVYSPGELPEDVQVLRRTYRLRLPKEAGERAFLLDEELELPAGAPAVERILSASLRPELTEQKVAGDKVLMKGNGNFHLVYRCPEGTVRTADWELPFSQFSELDAAPSGDANADIWMAVTGLETDLPDPGRIRVKAGMVGQYLVDEIMPIDLTEDAYSPFRELQAEMGTLALPAILEDRWERVPLEQTIPGQSGTWADVNFLPDLPSQHRTGQQVHLTPSGLFQTLYTAGDGTLQAANLRREGSLTIPADENINLDVLVTRTGKPDFRPGAEEINVSAEHMLHIRSTATTDLPMLTGLQLGQLQEPDDNRPTLVLCRAGKEALWDIAKRCGSTVAAIRAANGIETEPLDDRMLLIPVS